MENTVAQVLSEFNLKFKSMTKDRAFYICKTDKGTRVVKKLLLSTDEILFQHKLKEKLIESGFTNIDRLYLTASGLPYAAVDSENYIVTDHLPYRQTDFKEPSQIKEIFRIAAAMSLVCRDIKHSVYQIDKTTAPRELFDKNKNALMKYKKNVLKQKRFSDFDVIFLKNYDYCLKSLFDWYETASGVKCVKLLTEARERRFVCHNQLKEENILITPKNEIYVVNFNEISFGHYLNDLQALIKRYVKTLPSEVVPLSELLRIYSSVNPLGKDELEYLRALLIFPDKFIDISEKYYSKKRTWTPGAFESRIDSLMRTDGFFKQYISDFYKG